MTRKENVRPHDLLSCYVATHIDRLGLEHLNSEVPIPKNVLKRSIPDLICIDKNYYIPVVIELKTIEDPNARDTVGTIEQLETYLNRLSEEYPQLHSQLRLNRYGSVSELNFDYGIVGIILSPFEFNNVANKTRQFCNTIVWIQYHFEKTESQFALIGRPKIVIKANHWKQHLENRKPLTRLTPSYLTSNSSFLSSVIDELNIHYLAISERIYWYEKSYIAYRGTDTTGAICGFNGSSKRLGVEYHVSKYDIGNFISTEDFKLLKSHGLQELSRNKNSKSIVGFNLIDNVLHNKELELAKKCFVSLAKRSYELAKIEVDHIRFVSENNIDFNLVSVLEA